MFLPASGICDFDEEAVWNFGGYAGCYWSSEQDPDGLAYFLGFTEEGIIVNSFGKSRSYSSCRLVRE